jgi:cytochrome bd ubiquinol oxidase subunit II
MILFWVAIIALTTLLYVLLDGFDLGVGILFGFTRNEDSRRKMLSAISPVWDGNETWLVFTGTILWGAFPRVYATLLSAFYLPIILMLGALILRGLRHSFKVWRSARWPRVSLWWMGTMPEAHSAGSVPLPASAASGCVLATPFLGQDGWS